MIYFDNSATTRPCIQSLDAMKNALENDWGNPSSKHFMGLSANHIIEKSRKQIANTLGIKRNSDATVIFTSGGSEANNLAIFGSVFAKKREEKNGSRGKIFISSGEHSSVESCIIRLENEGFTICRIPTTKGVLDLDYLEKEADSSTILLSLMLVNNETGAIYDVKRAAEIVRKASPKAFIHCDAIQAYLKMKFTFKSLGVDSLSISSHKIFSPKGSGALIISPDVIKGKKLIPHIMGGGQELGFRNGTENVPSIAAFGAAAEFGFSEIESRIETAKLLRNHLISDLNNEIIENVSRETLSNIINITLPNIKSETMLNYLSAAGICVSSGSACSSHSPEISRALIAFGLDSNSADCSIRISLSHLNTIEEIDIFLDTINKGVNTLQRIKK